MQHCPQPSKQKPDKSWKEHVTKTIRSSRYKVLTFKTSLEFADFLQNTDNSTRSNKNQSTKQPKKKYLSQSSESQIQITESKSFKFDLNRS